MDFSDILLTVDYDRTLTAPDSTIPERNLAAIRYFIDHGGAFTVNTGRSLPMAQEMLRNVPMNAPILLCNGAMAYDAAKQEILFAHPIRLDLWDTIRRVQTLLPDLVVEVQGMDAHYRFTENPAWDAFCDHNNCPRGFAQPGDDLSPFLKFSVYGELRDVTIASLYDATEAECRRMEEAIRLLEENFGEACAVFRPGTRILDIHARGVSKARSARELQQRLGKKWLVCVGDGENDVSMLQEADFAYSPADGVVADRFETVCDCADGAVADVIFEKIPEILKKFS